MIIIAKILKIQLQRNRQRINEEAKQLEIYEEHIKTVEEATRLNQELGKVTISIFMKHH